jgi:hypothetical protein
MSLVADDPVKLCIANAKNQLPLIAVWNLGRGGDSILGSVIFENVITIAFLCLLIATDAVTFIVGKIDIMVGHAATVAIKFFDV